MSEVAVAEQITPTESQIPQESPENPTVPTGADEVATGASTGTEANPTSGTEGQADGFRVEDLPEWQEAVKAPSAEKAEPELPGDSLEDVQVRAAATRASNYQAIMQTADRGAAQLAERLGLDEEGKQLLWGWARGQLNGLHGNNDAHNAFVFNQSVNAALPEKDAEQFFSRQYRSQADAMKAIHALGAETKNAEWQAKVEKGEFVSKAQAEKIARASYLKGRGELEHEGGVPGTQSGASVRGTPGRAPNPNSVLEDPSASLSARNAAFEQKYGFKP